MDKNFGRGSYNSVSGTLVNQVCLTKSKHRIVPIQGIFKMMSYALRIKIGNARYTRHLLHLYFVDEGCQCKNASSQQIQSGIVYGRE